MSALLLERAGAAPAAAKRAPSRKERNGRAASTQGAAERCALGAFLSRGAGARRGKARLREEGERRGRRRGKGACKAGRGFHSPRHLVKRRAGALKELGGGGALSQAR